MPLLFSLTQCGLSDLKAGEVCQKQAEAVPEKPATSRLFNALKSCNLGNLRKNPQNDPHFDPHQKCRLCLQPLRMIQLTTQNWHGDDRDTDVC